MSRIIEGYDYKQHEAVARTAEEWQTLMAEAIKAGGRRRVEAGETYIHSPGGHIVAEIYANVPAPTGSQQT